jgi:hypothetical protein
VLAWAYNSNMNTCRKVQSFSDLWFTAIGVQYNHPEDLADSTDPNDPYFQPFNDFAQKNDLQKCTFGYHTNYPQHPIPVSYNKHTHQTTNLWSSSSAAKGAAFVKGLEFRVLAKDKLELHQTVSANQCRAVVHWQMQMCKGCCCTLPNGKQGLAHTSIEVSHPVEDTHPDIVCENWLAKIDAVFREYFALLRSALLAEKIVCCDPEVPLAHSPKGLCMGQKFATKTEALTENDQSRAVTQDSLQKQQLSSSRALLTSLRENSGFEDVTDEWLPKMTLSCTHHVWIEKMTLENPYWAILKESDPARPWVNPHNLKLRAMAGQPTLADRIVCAERDYPENAQQAFAPMGSYFFPPQVELVEKAGRSGVLKLSCGGTTKHLDLYSTAQWTNSGYHVARTSKDPQGRDVTGTLAALKLDGGYSSANSQFWNDEGKASGAGDSRRRGSCYESWGQSGLRGDYRPNNSGITDSCCPGLGLCTGSCRNNRPVPKPTDGRCIGKNEIGKLDTGNENRWNAQHGGADKAACFRDEYGETSQCESELKIKILLCKTCDCVSQQAEDKVVRGKIQLVRMEVKHRLTDASKAGACKPWFANADAGIRSYMHKFRATIMESMIEKCSKHSRSIKV